MIESRKKEHVKISLRDDVESRVRNGFEDITLVHRALPELDKGDIDIKTNFFGKEVSAPILIAGMTGGYEGAKEINKNLALAAQELGIPMGVGSQRAALENEKLASTYSIAREVAPDAFLIANLGAVQFAKGYGLKEARKAVEMISADALAVHLNPLHEAIQPEGDMEFKGCLEKLGELRDLGVPIIAKETGAGIAREEALALEKAGIAGIDVGGLGGTSFAAVEHHRRKDGRGKLFWDWGIPTAISTIECREYSDLPVISTGGIRNGLDVAKAIALGAVACGLALPLLRMAVKSHKDLIGGLKEIMEDLRVPMFLAGAGSVGELGEKDLIIGGTVREWLEARGIDCDKYANRSGKLQ